MRKNRDKPEVLPMNLGEISPKPRVEKYQNSTGVHVTTEGHKDDEKRALDLLIERIDRVRAIVGDNSDLAMIERFIRFEKGECDNRDRFRVNNLLRIMPYQEYLKTAHWEAVRTNAKIRAGYRCQLCNREGSLEVHHRTYERRGGELDQDVIALCDTCHGKFHTDLPTEP